MWGRLTFKPKVVQIDLDFYSALGETTVEIQVRRSGGVFDPSDSRNLPIPGICGPRFDRL
jgi:hypothetical protein